MHLEVKRWKIAWRIPKGLELVVMVISISLVLYITARNLVPSQTKTQIEAPVQADESKVNWATLASMFSHLFPTNWTQFPFWPLTALIKTAAFPSNFKSLMTSTFKAFDPSVLQLSEPCKNSTMVQPVPEHVCFLKEHFVLLTQLRTKFSSLIKIHLN